MFTIVPKTDFDFVGKRKIGFAVSTFFMVLGVYAIILLAQGKAKLGVDFGGGANLTLLMSQPAEVEQLRGVLGADFADADIQSIQEGNGFLIRMPLVEENTDALLAKARASISKGLKGNSIEEASIDFVGPAVSHQLWRQALWAVTVSLIGIVIYIAFRFDLRFGVGALVSTLHDVLAVLGIMVVCKFEFSLLVVTALLTIAGYSLTDTVVIFDRIRENLKARRSEPTIKVFNDSINETLSRTINTSMTTLLTVTVLYFWGGQVVHSFSLAMILGIIVGTYSSIFVATPVVIEWDLRSRARR